MGNISSHAHQNRVLVPDGHSRPFYKAGPSLGFRLGERRKQQHQKKKTIKKHLSVLY